ncbi:hypothetical protein PG994_003062 [Apiospora phragmitis]|uniref:Uncharacterized protein n=1 Tax=Apiospora phragmitis TaxID=2905665 RepID=A0ABR1W6Y3_9PEZI
MLRNDFTPLADEIPQYVKFSHGDRNDGSHLVKWIHDTRDLYPEEEKEAGNEGARENQQTEVHQNEPGTEQEHNDQGAGDSEQEVDGNEDQGADNAAQKCMRTHFI